MPRYDKYEPKGGGFRAPLAVATPAGKDHDAIGVGLDASGRVVAGAGATGVIGIYIPTGHKNAGDIVDVMTDGEIVEFTSTGVVGGAAATAGTKYFAGTDGVLSTTNTGVYVGHTVEATRLVARVAR